MRFDGGKAPKILPTVLWSSGLGIRCLVFTGLGFGKTSCGPRSMHSVSQRAHAFHPPGSVFILLERTLINKLLAGG